MKKKAPVPVAAIETARSEDEDADPKLKAYLEKIASSASGGVRPAGRPPKGFIPSNLSGKKRARSENSRKVA
jgi:hypothetical protein